MTRHEAFSSDPGASWHEAADVVVVGYGYAGAVAALEAHDAGANVLLIEKMPDPGAFRSRPEETSARSRVRKKASATCRRPMRGPLPTPCYGRSQRG